MTKSEQNVAKLIESQVIARQALNIKGNMSDALAWLIRQDPEEDNVKMQAAIEWMKRNRDWDGHVQYELVGKPNVC